MRIGENWDQFVRTKPMTTCTVSPDQSGANIFSHAAWTRWIAGSSGEHEMRAGLASLATRLELSAAQRPLWIFFVEKLLFGFAASRAPDPGDGWDLGKSPALDYMLRLEIAAGRFLGAIEEARESFGQVYAILTPAQREVLNDTVEELAARNQVTAYWTGQ